MFKHRDGYIPIAPRRHLLSDEQKSHMDARARETLDPAAQLRPIPPHLLRALCARVDAPKLRRAA